MRIHCGLGKLLGTMVKLYALATAGAVVGILLVTLSWETVGLGLLVPLFALPALFVYVLTTALGVRPVWRHTAFWAVMLPYPICLGIVAVVDATKPSSDGSGEMAHIMMLTLLISGAFAYVMDLFIGLTKQCGPSNEA